MRGSWHELTGLVLLLVGCAAQDASPDGGGGDGKADGVGPGANAAIKLHSAGQKGGFWELGSGELFSAFQSGYESTPFGLRYKFAFTLVGADDSSSSEGQRLGSAGECLDQSGQNYACPGGLMTPSTQKEQSIVAHDDRILMATSAWEGSNVHPRLMLADPHGAAAEVFADLPSITANNFSRYSRTDYHLERLPSGDIAFSAAYDGRVPDRSFVLADDGTVRGELEGYVRGHRDGELLVLQKPSVTEHTYVWWDPTTATTRPAFAVPASYAGGPPVVHRTIVTDDGGVVLWPYDSQRVFRFSPEGELELEDQLGQHNTIKGVAPTGEVLVHKYVSTTANVWDWSLVLRDSHRDERTIYTKADLKTDTAWSLSESTFSYPHFGGIYEPVIDDAGNMYVPMIKNVGGNTQTQTYLVGFTRTGEQMFGIKLDGVSGSRCLPHSVLPSQRLAVLCERRLTNELYLLGE